MFRQFMVPSSFLFLIGFHIHRSTTLNRNIKVSFKFVIIINVPKNVIPTKRFGSLWFHHVFISHSVIIGCTHNALDPVVPSVVVAVVVEPSQLVLLMLDSGRCILETVVCNNHNNNNNMSTPQ